MSELATQPRNRSVCRKKKNKAHRQVMVDGKLWRLAMDQEGLIRIHQDHCRRSVSISATELVNLAKRLAKGSLGL
jgi:hypothetical protein